MPPFEGFIKDGWHDSCALDYQYISLAEKCKELRGRDLVIGISDAFYYSRTSENKRVWATEPSI